MNKVNQEESEQNDVDSTKKEADSRGETDVFDVFLFSFHEVFVWINIKQAYALFHTNTVDIM